MRRLEERQDFGDIKTEWEPAFESPRGSEHWTDAEWRRFVVEANRKARASGSFTRFRSVDQEE